MTRGQYLDPGLACEMIWAKWGLCGNYDAQAVSGFCHSFGNDNAKKRWPYGSYDTRAISGSNHSLGNTGARNEAVGGTYDTRAVSGFNHSFESLRIIGWTI